MDVLKDEGRDFQKRVLKLSDRGFRILHFSLSSKNCVLLQIILKSFSSPTEFQFSLSSPKLVTQKSLVHKMEPISR